MDLLRRLLPPFPSRRLGALVLLAGFSLTSGKTEEPIEFAVKSAYLFKFGEYVDWPPKAFPSPAAPFVIGILGQDPFGARLEQVVQNRTVQGHPVLIRRFKRLEQVQQVHVLYIGIEEWVRADQIREELRGRNILTVSEKDARAEAAIAFVLQQGKVRFEIDVGAAERADLKLSSKLLGLAAAVKRSSTQG